MKYKKYLVSIVALSALLLAACSDSNTPAPASEAAPAAVTKEVVIEGDDNMKFSITEIQARRGETIKIILKNVGTMPKDEMGHNFVLLALRTDVTEFTLASSTEADHEYISPQFKSKVLAHTKLIGPGETTEVVFTAPRNSGQYDFVCSFPGHAVAGMKGKLIVL